MDSDRGPAVPFPEQGRVCLGSRERLLCHWRKLVRATGRPLVPSSGIFPPLNWLSISWPVDSIMETLAPGRGGLAHLCSTHLFINLPGDLRRVLP